MTAEEKMIITDSVSVILEAKDLQESDSKQKQIASWQRLP